MDCIRHDQTVNKALDGRDTGNLYLRWVFFYTEPWIFTAYVTHHHVYLTGLSVI